MDPIMEPRDIGQAYDIGLADGVIVVDSVADEYIRLQDECARLRCLIEQTGAQEWSRRVRLVEDEDAVLKSMKRALRRAQSVAGFYILLAWVFGAAAIGEAVFIFWGMR